MKIKNKKMIIVTGASKGLGKAICERLLKNNVDVCGIARNVSNLNFNAFECDVSNYGEVKDVAKKIKQNKWNITGLINTAGIASMNLALTTPEQVTQKIVQTNLLGTIFCCQIFAPFLIRNKEGSIINFSTIAVPIGLRGESIYVASKAGVEGFSKSFAREMSDFNIRVNCIAPGPIDTDLIKGVDKKLIGRVIKKQIITKQFNRDDICDLVDVIFDKKSASISGQVFYVGGV